MSSSDPPEGRRGVDRIEAFSDGVFAIAATLLVFALAVPRGPLGPGLAALGKHYYAFALSFFVIGSFWVAHHRLFRHVVRADDGLLWLNLVLLACIAFLPFPTAVLGERGQEVPAVALYSGSLTVTATVSWLVWWYATHRDRLVGPGVTDALRRRARLRSTVLIGTFSLSTALAFVATDASTWVLAAALAVPLLRRRAS